MENSLLKNLEPIAMEDSLSPLLPPTSETVVIERTHRPNGSVSIKSSTTTSRVNGYRDVRVEYFIIPSSSNAASAGYYHASSPGSSPPPLLPDYLRRVEYHVVPPGLEVPPGGGDVDDEQDDDSSSTAYFSLPAPNRRVHFEEDSFAGSHARSRNVRRKNTIAISIMGVLSIVLLVIIGVALTQDYRSHLPHHETSRDNSYDAGGNKSRNETSADDIEHVNRTNNVIGDE